MQDRAPELGWRLCSPYSVAGLLALSGTASRPAADRRRAVEALGFIADRAAGEAMVDIALAGPEDVRPLAAWWVEHNDLDLWREFHLKDQLGATGIENAELRWSSGILTAGSKALDVDVSGSKRLWLVVTDGKKGQSCDWVDWLDPVLVGPEGETRLASLEWTNARSAWGSVNKGKNTTGGPLKLEGKVFADGIGTHARSEIAFSLPPGTARFRALAALDDGGTSQGGSPDVEFQVWTDRARDPDRWRAEIAALADPPPDPDGIERAAERMAATREGGLELLRLAADKKLSPAAIEAVGRHIFRNPDLSVRALASEHFPRATIGLPLPGVAEIAALPADAARGKRVFFGEPAGCSTCHAFHGRGGDVGPDLSSIVVKYGKPEILDAILNPSAAIAHGYDAWTIETEDGVVHTGFIQSEGAQVVIKDTSGRRHAIPAGEIVSRTKQRVSTMPDNVATGLKGQDLADLARFLSEDPRAPGRRLAARNLFNGRDLAGWTFFLEDPKARMEDTWSVEDGVLSCKGMPIGYIRTTEDFTNFVLTLEWRFDPALGAGNSGVLLRMVGEDKVWPNSIEAQLHSRNAGDIWNIDEFPMEAERARTSGRRTEKKLPCNEKPLGEWNRYVITLDGGELTLEVNGEVQNGASWCEEVPGKICLQSEGAAIQFRAIEIREIER